MSREQVPGWGSSRPRTRTGGPHAQVRLRPGEDCEAPGSPEAPFFVLFSRLPTRPWTALHSATLPPRRGRPPHLQGLGGRNCEWRTLATELRWRPAWGWGAPGGAGRTLRRRGVPAPAPPLWGFHLAPPPAHGRRRGWRWPRPRSALRGGVSTGRTPSCLRWCAGTMARHTHFLETWGILPALLGLSYRGLGSDPV